MNEDRLCQFCKKIYSNKANCKKHKKSCKNNPLNFNKTIDDTTIIKLLKIVEEQKEEINNLKNQIESRQINNITIFNTSQSLKDIISNLVPINFEDMKEQFETNLSNKYIDKGIEGLARFICDIPCNNKFITTDYARKVIAYKTPQEQIISDPKANILLNTAIKKNADLIIEKAEDRYQYWKSQINEARKEDIEPDTLDLASKIHTRKLKNIAENAKNNVTIEAVDATNLIVLKGVENKMGSNAIEE